MGKTFRASGNAAIPSAKEVKDSNVRPFARAWKRSMHHRERQSLRTAMLKEMEVAL